MGGNEQKEQKIWTRDFALIFCANICYSLGVWIIVSLLPKYADSLGLPSTVIGAIVGSFGISALLLKIISAPMIDTCNNKHIIIVSYLVICISYLGISFSYSASLLIGFRVLQGCAMAFTSTCVLVVVSSILPDKHFAQGIGIFSIGQAVCQALAPSIALNIALLIGYNSTFLLASLISALAIIMVAFIKLPYKRTDKKFKISLRSVIAKEAILPTIVLFFLSVPFFAIQSFLILYGGQLNIPDSQIGFFFMVYAGILTITRPFYGKLADRFGYVKILIPAALLFACAFIMISKADSLTMLLLAAVMSACGYGSCQPALQSLCMRLVSPERRGAASCTCYLGIDCGAFLGPVTAGALVEAFGYRGMWLCMVISALLCVLLISMRKDHFVVDLSSDTEQPGATLDY